MWSKITNALKSRQPQEEPQGEVLHKVYEQHPNLSVFHPSESRAVTPAQPSPPPSPTRSTSKKNVLKLLSRQALKDEGESSKAASLRMPGLPKKVRSEAKFNTLGSGSQLSSTPSSNPSMPSPGLARSNSMDMLGSSKGSSRSPSRASIDVLRRPSLDMLRNEQHARSSQETQRPTLHVDPQMPPTPGFNDRMGSVRSILREPNTPGTGQNVRFFSRDAYKVISPDQSASMEAEGSMFAPVPPPKDTTTSFMDSLQQAGPKSTSTPAPAFMRHSKSNSKSSRPSVAEVFSPLMTPDSLPGTPVKEPENSDMSLASPAGGNASSIFNISQPLDLHFDPPGLGFDVDGQIFDQSLDLDSSFNQCTDSKSSLAYTKGAQFTSTPPPKRKEDAERNSRDVLQIPLPPSAAIDETIFHADEIPQRLPTTLHERSQSFTLGHTVFYSMGDQKANDSPAPLSNSQRDSNVSDSSSVRSGASSTKSRARAISDSMLQTMLRGTPKVAPPEDDINDDRSEDVQVYSAPVVPEPDPFSAHAGTYYTPQVNIPPTPPRNVNHARKTSKEENLIYSLQAQLALQTELCQQYEADLRARDELVEILGKKLSDASKEESKRQAAIRTWKKRVNELQRMCRHLEEEVDSSRQMSMERSIMDEASGEALRMLHRQIAALERDKSDQVKREQVMKEEIETLEVMVKEKSEDVVELKQILWNRDESVREFSQGLRDVKAQVDEMGNVSMAYIDEDELRRLKEEKEHAAEEERSRHRVIEATWQQEKEEFMVKLEGLQAEKTSMVEDLEKARQQLKNREEEYDMLKGELEAQWAHTEGMTSKIQELERARIEVEQERDELRNHVDDLENRINQMELEWNENENRKNDLETEIENLLALRQALEKDRDQIEYDLQQEQERADTMVHERDGRIAQLEEELQFNNESNARLQENNRRRDDEVEEYRTRVVRSEGEAEALREEIASLKREYNRLLDEQSRLERDSFSQDTELKSNFEKVIKEKAESDVELKSSRDQVAALKDEVERLRRHVHGLQQESADKEVRVANLEKQKQVLKEDMNGMNIALDAKQQELDLMKRQLGVRGTAGMTPAPNSKIASRRDSAVFNSTPISLSRPPSAISDNESISTSKKTVERRQPAERPPSSASAIRPAQALAKSSRANSVSSGKGVGSMGPPSNPTKPRASTQTGVTGNTPTPTAKRSGIARSSAVSPTGTPLPHRRVSSAISALEQRSSSASAGASGRPPVGKLSRMTSPVQKVVELEEKENVGEAVGMVVSARKRVLVPS
ncbi:hypothetical protein D9611_000980 [Ephemerocybe angulata]|uniref:Uncharacterized protein n=1 Tax=Ephemerocybe angulata TaxID=980116 RepID=A0A8H5F7H0_9AGAR|nr:hypothetical protein D9611_000980 [Tulosesus angulatus]